MQTAILCASAHMRGAVPVRGFVAPEPGWSLRRTSSAKNADAQWPARSFFFGVEDRAKTSGWHGASHAKSAPERMTFEGRSCSNDAAILPRSIRCNFADKSCLLWAPPRVFPVHDLAPAASCFLNKERSRSKSGGDRGAYTGTESAATIRPGDGAPRSRRASGKSAEACLRDGLTGP